MEEASEEKPDGQELLLGKLALRKGLLTRDQLREALREQARPLESGGKVQPLGEILVTKGFLTESGLHRLLDEQHEQLSRYETTVALLEAPGPNPKTLVVADSFLGRILVQTGSASAEDVHRCLRIQAEAIENDLQPIPRLGEVLVARGFATGEAVAHALAIQRKTILECKNCGRKTNGRRFDPGRTYPCPACTRPMEPLPALDDIRVSERAEAVPAPLPVEPGEIVLPPAAGARSPTGTLDLGKYTILRQLGAGGMGVVFLALDTTLNRRVALKMLVTALDPDQAREDEQRFLREARMAARLPKHPSIAGVYEAGVVEGRRYIAMEFIQGRPLGEWRLAEEVTIRREVEILREVALAVHHAHEHGVVHRDLKPDNVLVDADGRPHITDFGLAKPVERDSSCSTTDIGVVVGTPGYMSPEQARGLKTVDGRSDIYCIGAILFEVLTGRLPFEGATVVDLLAKIVQEPAPAPSSVARSNPGLPSPGEFDRICLKALEKKPELRYQTAKALAEDLDAALSGKPIPAPEVPRRPARRRWKFRR
jgi:predicted Ser/Thr protein kinase